jgi:alkylation response protein AidB-like acyl-CoA dehydrogenase
MAPFVGAMQRQLDGVVRRARTRRQFGQPISRFQAVAHRVADMKLRLDISRLLLHRAAEAREGGARAPLESSEAKLWISEAFVQNSLDALRIFGGEGYLDDSAAAMDLRDALGAPIFSGTSDVQRSIVARMLGL